MSDTIAQTSLRSFDGRPIEGTSVDMLHMTKVVDHIAHAVQRRRYTGPTEPLAYLQHHRCLVPNDQGDLLVTPAGILCFGTNPQDLFPHAVIDFLRYRSKIPHSNTQLSRRRGVGGTILDQIVEMEQYLADYSETGMVLNDRFERVEKEIYPAPVRREVSINLIAHRDYDPTLDGNSSAQIKLFPDRITWTNPGGLMGTLNLQDLFVIHKPRNPVIFKILDMAGYVEGAGQGLNTIVSELKQEGMQPPVFDDISHAFFVVTIYGREQQTVYPGPIPGDITDRQMAILLFLHTKGGWVEPHKIYTFVKSKDPHPITDKTIQRDLAALIKAGLIQDYGKGRGRQYRIVSDT